MGYLVSEHIFHIALTHNELLYDLKIFREYQSE